MFDRMSTGLVWVFMWISLRLGGSDYQTPIVHYCGIMNVGCHQMLQYDWSILVTCECIIIGSGIMYHILLLSSNLTYNKYYENSNIFIETFTNKYHIFMHILQAS